VKTTSVADISVIVPVYNEEQNIYQFLKRLIPVVEKISERYEIIFSLDPSTDNTEQIISEETLKNPRIKILKMSRRFGQPAATMAGLMESSGNKVVVIDADLQDPPELITELNLELDKGFDVVYATRKSRQGESLLKRVVSSVGYKIINHLSDVSIPVNTGDFRIMTRRVVNEICALREKHGFLRGLVAFVGFKQTFLLYDRDSRYRGKGNYNRYWGSIKIGLNGLIGFSVKPLTVMSLTGGLIAISSFLLGSWYAFQHFFGFSLTPGLPTTVILISFFAGIQILSLGLVGEYVARIYEEVKNRPMFIVEKKVGFDE
jgi:glycosyltransferase involved in cell wall biosynthesis